MGMLRAWNERGKCDDVWGQLRMVVVHSTEPYAVMDLNQSPFNVGLSVELSEFTGEQVVELAGRHGLEWGDGEVAALMERVGGTSVSNSASVVSGEFRRLVVDGGVEGGGVGEWVVWGPFEASLVDFATVWGVDGGGGAVGGGDRAG